MSLYSEWKARAESLESDAAYQQYWSNYFSQETEVYKQVLLNHDKPLSGTVKALSEQVGMDPVAFVGYSSSCFSFDFFSASTSSSWAFFFASVCLSRLFFVSLYCFEKLFFNMHEAKADWLFNLPEWNGVLSEEKRHEITKAYRASKIFVAPVQVGRNDPCPCGSGKKYKNCCGKNK